MWVVAEALDVSGLEQSSWLLPGERKGGIRFLGLSIPVEACLTIPNWQIFPTILQLLKKCDENAPS